MNNLTYPQMKILQTSNCILRPANLDDAYDIFEYYKDEKVVKYLPFNSHKTLNDSKKFIKNFFINHYKKNECSHYAVVYKTNNKVIGNVGFNNIKIGSKVGEIGICINPNYWGNNLSTQLTNVIIEYGFMFIGLEKIIAITYKNNNYSKKSLYDLGFKYVGKRKKKLKNKIQVCYKYELSKKDYYEKGVDDIYEV